MLTRWISLGQITADELAMAHRLQRVYAIMVGAGMIDGRACRQDAVAAAHAHMRLLLPIMGERNKHALVAVVCRGMSLGEAARTYKLRGGAQNASRRLLDSLADMASHRWGTDRCTPAVDIDEMSYITPRAWAKLAICAQA